MTGASTGIGKALALEAARLGAKVVLTARSEQLLQEVKAQCLGEFKHLLDYLAERILVL